MPDWSGKNTHDMLTKHGYKKSASGPVLSYQHPEEKHKIEIDRNMYKHTKGNGEVTRGHVTNLPVAMRQLHPPKERMMEVELDINDPKRKNDADDKMTGKGITDRFKNDTAFEKGDWGKTQKKYAPGPTYEMMTNNLLRAVLLEAQSFDPQDSEHTENPLTACSVCGKDGHVPAKHFGKALAGENNQPVKEDFKSWADSRQDEREKKTAKRQGELEKWRVGTKDLKYSKPKDIKEIQYVGTPTAAKAHNLHSVAKRFGYQGGDSGGGHGAFNKGHHTLSTSPDGSWMHSTGRKLNASGNGGAELHKHLEGIKESSSVEPKVIGHFIQHHLPSGKKHRGAMMDTHLRELGGNDGRLSTGEKVTKDTILKHWNAQQPKTYKYEWDKETKEAEGCPDCGKPHDHNAPCAKKSLLFGDEKSVQEGMKFSRQHDSPEKAEAHKTSLMKQGVKAWVNNSPDGTHHTFWMQEDEKKAQRSIDEAKKKKWDKIAHVAALARSTVGPIKKGQVIIPKKDRKPKYKVDYMKD